LHGGGRRTTLGCNTGGRQLIAEPLGSEEFMNAASEAEADHEWPRDYVRTALWFLAVDARQKRSYLPPPFPEISFECQSGQFATTCPLRFILGFSIEAIHAGILCGEWDDTLGSNAVRDQLFRELHGIVWGAQAIAPELEDGLRMLESESHSPFVGLSRAAERYAIEISGHLSWGPIHEYRHIPCEHLLNEYSHGAYAAVLNR
jgi:hypothetical protein